MGQISQAQNAILEIAFLSAGLFVVVAVWKCSESNSHGIPAFLQQLLHWYNILYLVLVFAYTLNVDL